VQIGGIIIWANANRQFGFHDRPRHDCEFQIEQTFDPQSGFTLFMCDVDGAQKVS